jgi:hypothetical protein
MTRKVQGADGGRKPKPATAHRRPVRQRRESGNVTMAAVCVTGAVGLAVLGNHGPEYDVRETSYSSREDCLSDWGTEESCPPDTRPESARHDLTYHGPRYYWDPERGHAVILHGDGSEHVATSARIGPSGSASGRTSVVGSFARGGFGHIGRGFSGGRGA